MTTLTRDEIIVCLQKLNVVGITVYQQEGIRQACEILLHAPEWTPFDVRRPEEWTDVLGYFPDMVEKIEIGRFMEREDGLIFCHKGKCAHEKTCPAMKFTHWMPLPESANMKTAEQRAKGWGNLSNSKKAHYFVNGRSICGSWLCWHEPYWKDNQELGNTLDTATCKACWTAATRRAKKMSRVTDVIEGDL